MEQGCCERDHVQASSLCPAEKKRSSNGSAQPNSAKRRRLETGPDPAEQSRTADMGRAATRHEGRGKEKTRADGADDDDESVPTPRLRHLGPIPPSRGSHTASTTRHRHGMVSRTGQPRRYPPDLCVRMSDAMSLPSEVAFAVRMRGRRSCVDG